MKKAFSQYTDAELLVIDNTDLDDAIRIESIQRGIKPPLTLSEAPKRSEWRGFEMPSQATPVWRICVDGLYSSVKESNIC